jgi:hypothetical protein
VLGAVSALTRDLTKAAFWLQADVVEVEDSVDAMQKRFQALDRHMSGASQIAIPIGGRLQVNLNIFVISVFLWFLHFLCFLLLLLSSLSSPSIPDLHVTLRGGSRLGTAARSGCTVFSHRNE